MVRSTLSRRAFGVRTLSALGAISGNALFANVVFAAANPESFYIRHWSSNAYVHPFGGRLANSVPLALWYEKGPTAQFYFEPVEGIFGYIVSAVDPRFCVHPNGGNVDAGNNTMLNLHEDRHPGAFFYIDQSNGGIRHISGRYWHPLGGQSRPTANTNLVVYDGIPNRSKFLPTSPQTDEPIKMQFPGESTGSWSPIICFGTPSNPLDDDIKQIEEVSVGLETSKVMRNVQELSVGTEVATDVLFGTVSTKLSTNFKLAFEQESSETWSKGKKVSLELTGKKGQSVCWWQRKYSVNFDNGSVFDYFSKRHIVSTSSLDVLPEG